MDGIQCWDAKFPGAVLRRADAERLKAQGADLRGAFIEEGEGGGPGVPVLAEPAPDAARWHYDYRALKTFQRIRSDRFALAGFRQGAPDLDGWLKAQKRVRGDLPVWKVAALEAIPKLEGWLWQPDPAPGPEAIAGRAPAGNGHGVLAVAVPMAAAQPLPIPAALPAHQPGRGVKGS